MRRGASNPCAEVPLFMGMACRSGQKKEPECCSLKAEVVSSNLAGPAIYLTPSKALTSHSRPVRRSSSLSDAGLRRRTVCKTATKSNAATGQ